VSQISSPQYLSKFTLTRHMNSDRLRLLMGLSVLGHTTSLIRVIECTAKSVQGRCLLCIGGSTRFCTDRCQCLNRPRDGLLSDDLARKACPAGTALLSHTVRLQSHSQISINRVSKDMDYFVTLCFDTIQTKTSASTERN